MRKRCGMDYCRGFIDKDGNCDGTNWGHKCTYSDYETKLCIKVDALGQAKRQEFLDLMRTGLNVGQASEKLGIDSMVGGRIIIDNIKSYDYLSKEAK